MEDEAHLDSTIEIRRRSASVSDDYSVQKTNDDATESKYSAVKVGYWDDRFLKSFIPNPDSIHRQAPEIRRGYWARYAAFELLLNKALTVSYLFLNNNNIMCLVGWASSSNHQHRSWV